MTKSNLRKKRFILAYGYLACKDHNSREGMIEDRHGDRNKKLAAQTFINTQNVRGKYQEVELVHKPSKATLRNVFLPASLEDS